MLTERGKQVRRSALKLMRENGLTHIGGSFSCAEILIALYDHVMTKDDVFILSKGHGCGVWYVLLREQGYSPKIETHPHKDVKNGIHFTSGSLGHGIAFGVGIALAKKIKGESGRVFVLCGDAECQEGMFHESMVIRRQLNLDNLFVLVDMNEIGGSSKIRPVSSVSWEGDDVDNIIQGIKESRGITYFSTVKCSGISFLENTVRSHSTWLTDEEYEQSLEELK